MTVPVACIAKRWHRCEAKSHQPPFSFWRGPGTKIATTQASIKPRHKLKLCVPGPRTNPIKEEIGPCPSPASEQGLPGPVHPCLSHPNSKHHANLQRLCRRRSKTHITNQRFELAQVELKGVLVNGAHHVQRRKSLQSRTGLQFAWKAVRILDLQRIQRQTFHISLNPGSDPSCKFFTVAITRGWPTPALHGVALAKADNPAKPFLGV